MKTAEQINEELRNLQTDWYKKLSDEYKEYDKFSSPFCFGISEKTIEEKNAGKPLIMYVGEEPRGWWFNYGNHHHESEIEYLQGYSIAYFEKQLYNTTCQHYYEEYKNDERNPFKRKNSSLFWSFLKKLHQKYSVCWNDLDKLHRITVVDGQQYTQTLCNYDHKNNCNTQGELHKSFNAYKTSLLRQEIDIIEPDIVIFMGSMYQKSIENALCLKEGTLSKNRPAADCESTVKDISSECNIYNNEKSTKVFWMCHPASLNRNVKSLYIPTVEKIYNLLKEA